MLTRQAGATIALLVAAAVLPRALLLASLPDSPLQADMVDYFDRARHLYAHGRLYPDAFRVPLYPVAVAGAFALGGPSVLTAQVLQTVVLTALALVTWLLAREMMSPRRAVLAGLLVAWYPGLVLYTAYVMAEPLFTLLGLLAILALRKSLRSPRVSFTLVLAGLAAGLATLTRQAGVSVVAGLTLATALLQPSGTLATQCLARAGVVLVGALLVVSVWTGRNWTVFDRWMPLETTGGITHLIANFDGASGRYDIADWQLVHDRFLGGAPEEFTRNSLAYRLAWQHIAADPRRIARLLPLRLGYLFEPEGREHVWLYGAGYFGERTVGVVRAVGWAVLLAFPLLVAGTLVSLVCASRPASPTEHIILLVLGVLLLQHLLLFGDSRFHLPFVPLFVLLALRPWAQPTRVPRVRAVAAVLLLLAACGWWWTRVPLRVAAIEQAAQPDGFRTPVPY